MQFTPKKSGALFAAALLTSSIATALGGSPDTTTAADKKLVEPVIENNPLCFANDALCFDFQERARVEIRDNNYDFNSAVRSPTDGAWLLNRVRLGLMWTPTSWLQVYVQGQDSREFFSDRVKIPGLSGAEGFDSFDLRQAYVQVGNPEEYPLVLKAGRQALSYGDERLIGEFDWNNFSRTFDAVKLSWQEKKWQLDAFVSSVVVIDRADFNTSDLFNGNDNHRDQIFSGLYFTDHDVPWGTLELYTLWLSEANGNVSNMQGAVSPTRPTTGAASRHSSFGTYGGHAHGDPNKLNGYEFDLEGAYQNGSFQGLSLSAFAVHAGFGYHFDVPLKPRLWAEYNFASGDSNPNDTNSETFQNLFPTNHKFYGYMDLIAWQNMHNPQISLQLTPMKNVTTELAYRAYWLASTNDVWYRANGLTAVRPLTPAAERANNFLGSELDFLVNWKVNKHLSFQAGYSHFFTGPYLADTGPSDAANFGYVMATVTF